MALRDLIPRGRDNGNAPALYGSRDPFMALRREMNRMFDDVFRGFDAPMPSLERFSAMSGDWPSVEVSDREKEIRVTAEVPGMDEKDIEVLLDDGALTLRGEKRSETEDEKHQFSERFYGRFERRIPIGYEIEEDKIAAEFKNGVLSVTLPKTKKAQTKAKRIAISGKH
jgi:HSP20 family protein